MAGLLALAAAVAPACGDDSGDQPAFCPADGMVGPGGRTYGRSADHGCRFVDEDGNLVTRMPDGRRLCYDGDLAAVPCE
jgi:hypothetical protein